MKKLFALVCALMIFSVTASAQELSKEDREKGVQYLEQTRDGVVAAVSGLSDAQMHFKAGPDRWSVAECLEHIALAEDYLFMNVTQNVIKAGPGKPDRDFAKVDAGVLEMIPDRSHKAQAPPQLVPTGRWTPDEALKHFLASREKTIEFMKTEPGLREPHRPTPRCLRVAALYRRSQQAPHRADRRSESRREFPKILSGT
jgi:uncharacterized damage-inducible protein DinB